LIWTLPLRGPKEDVPKESEQPKRANPEEKMDVDGKTNNSQAPDGANGAPLPTDSQQSASKGAAQLQDVEEHTTTQGKTVNKSKATLSQAGGVLGINGTWTPNILPSTNDSRTHTKKFSNELPPSVRLSKRNASTVDMDSTENAVKLKDGRTWKHHRKKVFCLFLLAIIPLF